ncbi:MAG TPA: hypothetical protein VEK74_06965 [Burkholderiaceae bacterium]|nr:hypothetical protein [Burkholderiaceae bacterium]
MQNIQRLVCERYRNLVAFRLKNDAGASTAAGELDDITSSRMIIACTGQGFRREQRYNGKMGIAMPPKPKQMEVQCPDL